MIKGSFFLALSLSSLSIFSNLSTPSVFAADPSPTVGTVIHVNRRGRTLFILDENGEIRSQVQVGIGKGGIAKKRSMNDLITPTGRFVVDIILSDAPGKCAIAPTLRNRYGGRGVDLKNKAKLQELFAKMNDLDFNGDGKPDRAYGTAYIGLNGPNSGPKLSKFRGRTYWYSIALHGTPDEKQNLGAMNSGGCVHVPARTLKHVLDQDIVSIGSVVVISDQPPAVASSPPTGRTPAQDRQSR